MGPDHPRSLRAGSAIDDHCAACKTARRHTVLAATPEGEPLRVVCGFCGSTHRYRGGERDESAPRGAAPATGAATPTVTIAVVSERERRFPPVSIPDGGGAVDLEMLLRRVIREEIGLSPIAPAARWRGGELVLRPGRPGVQEKSWPIETFFHKIVMLRNRLRVLEQQINGAELAEDVKIKLQGYVTGCYGTLTTFNVLFEDEDDRFRGSAGGD